ncbi:MAG: peptidoglycan-binding protein [Actinobacteria bacterium]|nr:peptidoglycan-binding protein [Actinomycetota bacterium]
MKRTRRFIAAAATATLLLVPTASPAYAFPAGNPAGCDTIATGLYAIGTSWGNLCWVGTWTSASSELTSGVQAFLILNSYNPGTWDKIFGPNTKNAVGQFQFWNGLFVDGTVGADTWGKIQFQINQHSGGCFPNGYFGPYCQYYVVLGTASYIGYLGQVGYVSQPWGVIDPSGRCMNWLATYVASC